MIASWREILFGSNEVDVDLVWSVFSCFPIEDMLGFLKRCVHVTKKYTKTYALTSCFLENVTQDKETLIQFNQDFKVIFISFKNNQK